MFKKIATKASDVRDNVTEKIDNFTEEHPKLAVGGFIVSMFALNIGAVLVGDKVGNMIADRWIADPELEDETQEDETPLEENN